MDLPIAFPRCRTTLHNQIGVRKTQKIIARAARHMRKSSLGQIAISRLMTYILTTVVSNQP
ncbi:MAG: hypothetical protein Q9M25_04955, partial [Mariprofundaceae bacterium]|nr:hypothetical protein [Mariprofundaceae bacterium]